MKKTLIVISAVAGAFLLLALIAPTASAQTAEKSVATTTNLPADVARIVDKSCVKCHMEPGNGMALSRLNFTKWNDYDLEKQASKTAAISKLVTKGKMPPKKFKKNNPEKVPTAADIKIINDWAKSVQVK